MESEHIQTRAVAFQTLKDRGFTATTTTSTSSGPLLLYLSVKGRLFKINEP